jgi:hypothetical protein
MSARNAGVIGRVNGKTRPRDEGSPMEVERTAAAGGWRRWYCCCIDIYAG